MRPQLPAATLSARRARLVVRCACELLGIDIACAPAEVRVPMSVVEFEAELRNRYGESYPELVFRTDSTLERARLERRRLPDVPRVVLRQGAPSRARRSTDAVVPPELIDDKAVVA